MINRLLTTGCKILILLLLFWLPGLKSFEATITSRTAGGAWSTPGTWVGGAVPLATDLVVIPSNSVVTTGGNQTCSGITISGTLTMATGNTLTVNGNVSGNGFWITGAGTMTISLTGNWSFNGTSTGAGATAIFTGSANQTLSGIITTGTTGSGALIINKPTGTVTLGSSITITGPFTLTSGTFDPTNNRLSASSGIINGGTLRVGTATWPENYTFTPVPAAGTTIDYYGSSPTINAAITYQNLKFSGTGTTSVTGDLTIQGDLTNTGSGTLNFGSNNVILSGTVAANTIAGFTTTGSVSMTKTAGTATLNGNVNATDLNITGIGGTLNLGIGYTDTFTGNWNMTGGTLNGGSSTLAIDGSANVTGGTFIANTGTVDYYGTGQRTIAGVIYYNATFGGSSNLNLPVGTQITGTAAINQSAKVNTVTGQNIPVSILSFDGVIQINGTWGSNQSPATNQDQNHFGGSGILTVGDSRVTAVFSGLTASQNVCFGATTLALSGIISAAGPVYPVSGEPVAVTINGITQNAIIAGGTGGFSLNFPISSIPYSATSYTITYAYSGDANLRPAAPNTSTTLTFYTPLNLSSQSTGGQTQCAGGSFTPITVSATGSGLTYQWYSNATATTTGGTSLGSANGAQTNSYTPQASIAGTTYYYCIITGSCSTVTSAVSGAFLVNPASVGGTIGGAVTEICQGGATGTMTLSGFAGSIVRWERQVNSLGWSSVGNFGGTTYAETPFSGGNWQFRALVQNGSCPQVYSTIANVLVDSTSAIGFLGGATTPICQGASIGLLTLAYKTGSIIQWEKRLNGGAWTIIANNTRTYTEIPSTSGTWDYRVLVQSGICSSIYSNISTVVVNPTLTITLGPNPVICKNTTVAQLSYAATTGNPNAYYITFDAAANAAGMGNVPGWGLPGSPININVPYGIAAGVYNALLYVATTFPVCSSITYPISVTVQDNMAPITITGNSTPCQGSSQTYNATSLTGATYSWAFPSGWTITAGSTTSSVTVTVGATAGNVQVSSSFSCGGSGTNQTLAVTPSLSPTAAITYAGTPFCTSVSSSQSVTLTGTSGGTYSASPSGLTINSSTGAITPSTSNPGTYTVTYNVTSSAGCGSATASTTVTITALPTATISYSGTPFCSSAGTQSVTLSGTGAYTGGTFSSAAGLSINSTTGLITPGSSTPGNYTVTYAIPSTGGCTATPATTNVTITALPAATISYPGTSYCKSLITAQAVTFSGTAGGSFSASPAGLSINSATGAITPGTSTAGTYTVTYTVAAGGGCGPVSVTAPVTITAVPTAAISYAGLPFCSSLTTAQSVNLTGTGAYTGGTYSSAAGLTINSITGAITPNTSTAGSYAVTYTIPASGGCASVPATTSITITALPIATFGYSGSPYCSNGTNPTPAFSGGGVAGTFSSTAGLNFVNTSTGQINLATSTPGTYTVTNTIAAANGCGVVTGTNTITITALPTVVISYSGSPFCSSLATAQTVSISGTGAYTGGTYSSTTGLTINSATGAIIPNTSTAGSYTVTYTVPASGGCGSVTATAPVTITALPTAAISYTGSPYCSSLATIQSVNLTGTGAYTGGTFSSTAGLTINSGTGAITPNTSTVGSYLVTYTIPASGGCGSIPATTSVTITSPPVATFSYTGSPYCTNGANPSPTFSGGGVAGAFSSSAGLNFVSTSTGQINLATSTPGTYTVTNTISATSSCAQVVSTSQVTINPATVINSQSTGTQSQCPGGTFSAISVSATGIGTLLYQWYSNATATATGGTSLGTANGAQTNSYTPQAASAGTTYYYCDVTGSCGTATSAVSGAIIVNPASVGGTIGGAVTEVCQGGATGTMTLTGFAGSIIQWERQVNSLGWSSVGNGGSATYAETPFSGGRWQYRALIQNGSCAQVYSALANVLVDSTTTVGNLAGATTPICQGASIGLLTLSSRTGSIIQWEKRLNAGAWTIIPNTTRTYTEIPSSGGTWDYRVLVQSGICSSSYSNIFTVVVNPTLTITLGPNPVICKNTTVAVLNYTATTGNPTAYSITFDAAAIAAGMPNVPQSGLPGSPININVPFGIAAGVYNAILSVATTTPVCSSITYPISITIQDNTIPVTITGSTSPCQGSSQTYNATTLTGASYNWVFPSGWTVTAGATTGSVTVTVGATAGNVQVTPVFTCGGSGTTQTLAVTPVPSPTAAIAYAGTPYCSSLATPQNVTLTGTSGGTFSASPSGLTINSSTGAITPSTSTPGTYTVTYNFVSPAGCGVVTASTTVTITALPSATISYSGSPFCSSAGIQSVTLSGAGAYTGGTFTSATGLSINGTTGLITPASSTPGNYTVTYTIPASGGCATVPATTNVTITTLPTATISYTASSYCTSVVAAQPVTITGTTGGIFSASPAGLSINSVTGAITPGTSTAGTYTVTYTIASAGGCGPVTATASILITTVSTAVISYSGSPFCSSLATAQSVNLTGTGAYTGGTYSSTTGLSINSGTGAITPGTSSVGSYTVTYTIPASGGCASVPATTSVSITSSPVATFSYTGSPYCSNGTNPTPTFSGGGVAGTFSSSSGLNFVSASTGQVNLATSTPGTYTVTNTIAAANGCGTVTATNTITITALPAATISYPGSPYCKSLLVAQPVTLTGTTGGTFSATPAGLSLNSSTGAITPGTSTAGAYTVTYSISAGGGCGAVTATAPVTITAVPTAAINYTGSPFCSSIATAQSVNLTGTGAYTGGTYSSTTGLTINSGTGAITPGTSTVGTYTVTYTIPASGGCASVPATTSISITSLPVATFSYSGSPYCLNGTNPTPTFSGGGIAGVFSSTAGLNFTDTSTGQINLSTSTSGTYTVTNTIAASGGCAQTNSTSSVIINPSTVISSQSTGPQTKCIGGTFSTISVTASGPGLTYQWYSRTTAVNTGGTALGTTNGARTNRYTPQATVAGTLYYYCVVTGTCGTVSSAVSGAFVVNPATAITGQSTATQTQCINGTFTPVSVTATGVSLTYQWFSNLSASNSSGTSLGSANGAQTSTYTPQTTTAGTLYYYCVVTGTCGTVTSAVSGAFVVNPATAISSQSTTAQTQCINGVFTPISVAATGVVLTYQWYRNASASNSSGTSLGTANGAQTSSYTPQATAAGTLYYYCIVTGTCGTVTSAVSGAFVVNPATAISSQSTATQTQCITGNFTPISVTATGVSLTYQWYSNTSASNSSGTSLGAANGAQTSSYTPQATAAGTLYYYCVVTGSCGTVTSAVSGAFVVNPATAITSQLTGAQSQCINGTFAPISVTASGTGVLTYQWYSNTISANSGGLSLGTSNGAQTSSYTPQATTAGTLYYCCVVTGSCGSVTSNVSGAFTVNPATSITSQSTTGQTTCLNVPFTSISITASGTGTLTYQWYSNATTGTSGGTSLGSGNGAQTNTYTPQSVTAGTLYYYCVVHSDCGSDITSSISGAFIVIADLTWTGAISTDWNTIGNWSCPFLPDLTKNVLIPNVTNQPVLSSGPTGACKNLVINSGSSLTVIGNTLQIAETITNSGIFTASAGTIEMKGTTAQTIGANTFAGNALLNLTISNATGVTLAGPLNVTGVVKASVGNLSSGGNLTLISNALQTALVDGSGTGDVLGNVTMQRYLPSSYGYKYFSSPFQSATVNEFANDLNLASAFPSFYKYDEDNHRDSLGIAAYSSGWVNYTATTGLLNGLAGYAANFGTSTSSRTVDMTGVLNNGSMFINLFNHNRKYTKGFNLAGNPYPSPIDWNATSGWTKTNIDNAIYFFNAGNTDQYTGVYSSYINGHSNGNGDNVIASMQGFFVHVSDGAYPVAATLGMSNAVRINNLVPTFREAAFTGEPVLTLSAMFTERGTVPDASVLYFDSQGTKTFDKTMDALKIMNTDLQVPNIYILSEDSRKLSIKAITTPADSITKIPLGIYTLSDGWISISTKDIGQFSSYLYIYLVDADKGITQDLKINPEYKFYIKTGTYDRRFSLVFSLSELKPSAAPVEKMFTFTRSATVLKVTMNLPYLAKGTLFVTNTSGQILLLRQVTDQETVEINPGISSGLCIITVTSGNKQTSEKILMRKDYE